MLGDDPEDYMARSAVKWLLRLGVNVMTMSPGKKDYEHHNYSLERIERAIAWMRKSGIRKIGIAGASTTGTLALTAASFFPDITLTIAMPPERFCVAGLYAGQARRLQGMAEGRVALFLSRKAASLCAVLLSASALLTCMPRKLIA